MKFRLPFACGVLALIGLTLTPATAQSTFPTKAGARIPFRGPVPTQISRLPRAKANITLQSHATYEDHGNVSVLHDDGTLIVPANQFDLSNLSVLFTPQGAGYTVQTITPTFVNPGTNAKLLQLAGGSASVPMPFTFKFYGTNYTSAFVNSGGNLTFGAVDQQDFYYGLNTVMTGPARIAALFDYMVDQYGGGTGSIGYDTFPDHMNFYWFNVEDFNQAQNTFEIILFNNGAIEFNYSIVQAPSATVGISPANSSSVQLVDFSQQTTPLPFTASLGEVFSQFPDLDLGAVTKAFYQSHPDNYDGVIAFTDSDGMTGAYSQPVRNATKGINLNCNTPPCLFDYGTYFGSKSRLFITANMGSVSQYPADPTQIYSGTFNTLETLGQLVGSAWMPYVETNPPSLLGLQGEWSFTMDAQGSVMGGNLIQNLGNGQFKTINATYHYSPLDEYLMGLRAAANVPDWFVVQNPVLISGPSDFSCIPIGPDCQAEVGVQFSGTLQDVSLQKVITAAGQRVPAASTSQKNFNIAFVLVTPQGQVVNPQNLAQVDTIQQQWSPWFVSATDKLGGMSTALQAFAPTITSVSPNQGLGIGGSLITITGTNFQSSSSVTIGGNAATVISATGTTLQVLVPPSAGASAAPVTVTNPDGQSASSNFTYSNGAQSQLQLTLAASGSLHAETAGTAPTVQVGYGVINPPTGVAVIRSFANGSLVSEAAVPATPAATQWVMYAEVGSGGVSTGIAMANPGTSPASLTLTLSNGAQSTISLAAGAQVAKFVNELFPGLASFLGTMTVQSSAPISIVALRGTQNSNGQFIISTIPLSSGAVATGPSFAGFPIIADGGGYNTDIILVNSGTSTSSGTIGFSFNVKTDAGTNTQFTFSIPAGGMYRLRTAGAPASVISGYASMQVNGSSPVPNATAIIRVTSGTNLISETAVPAQNQITQALMFGSLETNLRTGIALLNGNPQAALVTLTPLNAAGQPVGNQGSITVPAYQNVSKFLDEMIPTLPVGFEGSVLVQSSAPIFGISLRGSTTINGFLMSTTPVLDLTQSYSGTYYFPQVVDGGGYTTEFLTLNAATPNVQLQFFDNTGKAMPLLLK